MQSSYQYYPQDNFGAPPIKHSPAVNDIISLLNISAILALVIGILEIIWGAVEIVYILLTRFMFGIVQAVIIIVLGILAFFVYINVNGLKKAMENGRYSEVKEKIVIWMVIAFIACLIIGGIPLLIAYLKLDELTRSQYYHTPPPPPQPYYPPPSIPPQHLEEYYQQPPPP